MKKHASPRQRAYRAAGVWLVAAAFIGGVAGSDIIPQLRALDQLRKSHQTTLGQITATYPQMHSTCLYRFSVQGRSYEKTGRLCGGAIIGQKVTVYFMPENPAISEISEPGALFKNDLIPFGLALVTMPAFAALMTYRRA